MDKPNNYKFVNFNLLEFNQYNKIYFTQRSAVEAIASECVAYTLKKHTYKSVNELFKIIPTIKLTNAHHNLIKEYVYSENLVTSLKQYLTINGMTFEDLSYDEIPNYLMFKFPNTGTSHVPTNYNYRQIIKDYDSILPIYNSYKL